MEADRSRRALKTIGGFLWVIFVAFSAWELFKPSAPWVGLSDCALAEFAYERFGDYARAEDFRNFLSSGVVIEQGDRENELQISFVFAGQTGRERAKSAHLTFHPFSGRITSQRVSEAAADIRAGALSTQICEHPTI